MKHKEQYEKLRSDIAVKMQFLDENRVSNNYFVRFVNLTNFSQKHYR